MGFDIWHGKDHLRRDDDLYDPAIDRVTMRGDWSLNGDLIDPEQARRLLAQWSQEDAGRRSQD